MKLTNEQAAKLKTFLMRKRPCIVRQDERESLRIEGETGDGDWDALGYRSVVAVIQRGLGDQADVVRQVLGIAAKVQNDNNLDYPVLLFSFGWDDGVLHGTGRNRSGGPNIRCDGWVKELCDLASADIGAMQPKIPSLFPPAAQEGASLPLRGEDLLIFFCGDRSMRLTEEARSRYAKPLKHAVWIYCEGKQVDMGLGFDEENVGVNHRPAMEMPMKKGAGLSTRTKASLSSVEQGKFRGLSPEFMEDLAKGLLNPLLRTVRADHTLSLNIRADCVNIYYRGGSLLKITELSEHRYEFGFDEKYLQSAGLVRLGISPQDIVSLSRKIAGEDGGAVEKWVRSIPALQAVMNVWFGEHPHLEREFQQLVERMNNSNPSTDYFICDIEYTNTACRELRADLVALKWPSTAEERKRFDGVRLAIIEMKHGDGALSGGSGLVEHIQALDKRLESISASQLGREMVQVFNQRVELGLIDSRKLDKIPTRLQSGAKEDVEYIILLSDHDPASSILRRELGKLPHNPAHFNIKVAIATFSGYGLFDEGVYALDDFLRLFCEQTGSAKNKVNAG